MHQEKCLPPLRHSGANIYPEAELGEPVIYGSAFSRCDGPPEDCKSIRAAPGEARGGERCQVLGWFGKGTGVKARRGERWQVRVCLGEGTGVKARRGERCQVLGWKVRSGEGGGCRCHAKGGHRCKAVKGEHLRVGGKLGKISVTN